MRTAAEQGWARLSNGDLLNAAQAAGFEDMVTADQSLEYQQNLKSRSIALVVLGTNKLSLLEAEPEPFIRALDAAKVSSYQFVEYKRPPKRRRPRPPSVS